MSFFSLSDTATEQILTEGDIAALISLISSFSHKWYDIGIGLGFTPSELNMIRSKPLLLANAPTSYLVELLSWWMQWPMVGHPRKSTLKALCESLRSSHVGLGSLADEVERKMRDSITSKMLAMVYLSALF